MLGLHEGKHYYYILETIYIQNVQGNGDFMDYTIKDVCQKLDMTVHTVRHYCDMGLVPNLRHDKNGNRIFDDESINWLQGAKFLRASGLSIPEIRNYFALCQDGISTIRERQKILIQLRDRSQKELDDIKRHIDCLNERINSCQDAIDNNSEDSCNPLNW